MLSVIILTKNEALDLPACLRSLTWCDDVHVLDSGSTDDTINIAQDFGARVCSHPFESFGKQRNFAIDNLDIRHEWILFLDADEIITDKLRRAMHNAINTATDEIAGFYCCGKLMLGNTWLKRSDNFPKWQFRLLRKGRARFTDFGHGQKETAVMGKVKYIKEPYLHYGMSKGWAEWIDRHNSYSSKEAIARLDNCPPFKNLFSRHKSTRNPALKSRLSRIPGWPFLRFFLTYFVALGFLEGPAALVYCVNNFYYEFLIQIKLREIQKRRRLQKTLPFETENTRIPAITTKNATEIFRS
jgi:glycosyltransferase involved in cell wall biosynthesis